MHYITVILILLVSFKTKAQPTKKINIDSILGEIPRVEGIEKVKLLNKASSFYKLNKPDTAIILARQALTLYTGNENPLLNADSYASMAESFFYLAQQDSSVSYYLKAIAIAENQHSRKRLESYYNGLGTTLYQLGDFERAISYMKKASEMKLADGDLFYYAVINGNIAATLQRLKKYKEAILILKDSEKKLLGFNNIELLANIYNSLGSAYLFESDIRNLDSAELYFNKNIYLISKPEDEPYRLAAYANIADVYIEKKQYEKALENLQKALILSQNLLRNQERVHIYGSFSSLYESKTDYKNALLYKNLQNNLQDSLLTAEKRDIINNLESQYQLEKKDVTIKQQELLIEKEKNKIRFIILVLLLLVIIIAAIAYILWLRKRTKEIIEQEKTRFFSNVVHEFRTPLTLIKGPVEELKKSKSLEEDKSNLLLIERSSERLLALVNQLLDLSKIEGGKYMLDKKYGTLSTLFEQITSPFHKQALTKGIHFKAETKELPASNYLFSPDALEKITDNLLSNAFKHTNTGGSILLKVFVHANNTLNIEVDDTGNGISKKDLPHIFERFYQSGSTKNVGGTGLGLSLTKELVDLMQGTISIESELDKGTLVKVTVPISNEKLVNTQAVREDTNEALQVVLVEDDMEVASFIISLLKKEGYIIHAASNGKDGQTLINDTIPDIIITDIMMPVMDGLELALCIKSNPVTMHIPIIGLSAKGSQTSKVEALERGIDVYITKPFYPDELLLLVNNLIQTIKNNQQLYQEKISNKDKPYNERVAGNDAYLTKILSIIDKNIDNSEYSVDELAAALFISRSQLHRKIKSLTGYSTSHFIRIVRLEKAKDLLITNYGNVTEVAYLCGFSSQSYFTKSFTEYFGASPSSFLK